MPRKAALVPRFLTQLMRGDMEISRPRAPTGVPAQWGSPDAHSRLCFNPARAVCDEGGLQEIH